MGEQELKNEDSTRSVDFNKNNEVNAWTYLKKLVQFQQYEGELYMKYNTIDHSTKR